MKIKVTKNEFGDVAVSDKDWRKLEEALKSAEKICATGAGYGIDECREWLRKYEEVYDAQD